MGNRAVICVAPDGKMPTRGINLYLHWNGGAESVLAFCEAAKRLGVRDPAGDNAYAMARLAQIVGNFMGGALSLGLMDGKPHDPGDNGIFGIGKDWAITYRSQEGPKAFDELNADGKEYYNGVLAHTMRNNVAHFHELPYDKDGSDCPLVQGEIKHGHLLAEHGHAFIKRAATKEEAEAAMAYTAKWR